jgi:hypothetical protein
MKGRFYVYVIYNPWSGRPVYVGKGQGRRDRDHRTDIARTNTDVVDFMRKCREGGREAEIKKEYERLTEAEALQREIVLIAKYGRKDNGTGVLLNRTDGGSGTSGYKPRRVKLDPTDRIVVLPPGRLNPRHAGSGRWQRYDDILRSKTVGAFLAKHPNWEITIKRYIAAGLIELQPRKRTSPARPRPPSRA